MTVLLTGAAGFIGYHVAEALLGQGETVVGVDSLNDYYDVGLKRARLDRLVGHAGFRFEQADIADRAAMAALAARAGRITGIVHLAAQAGVRFSMVDPYAYVHANVLGHLVMLELARGFDALEHLLFASTSSVYGLERQTPFRETQRCDTPTSLYAATKRADELMSHAYGHLYGLPQTGLRFFTVYGPWGRPDMAYYGFAQAIVEGRPITLYDGNPERDFTYVDDIVRGVLGVLGKPPAAGELRLLNIGNTRREPVARLITLLEESLGRRAVVQHAARPAADVASTLASVDAIAALTGYAPSTTLEQGVPRFVAWFSDYHRIA